MAFSVLLQYNKAMEKKELQTSTTAQTETVSRAEYDSLAKEVAYLRQENQYLLEQLGLAKKRQFGTSSEKMQEEVMDQLSLTHNEAEACAYGTVVATPEQIRVKEY